MTQWSGYLDLILQGALVTIELTLMGSVLALAMAFLAGIGRVSRFFIVRALATTYIEFFRGTSIFVQLFWAYFVLPFAGLSLTPLQAGVLALGLNVGAYAAEVVRSQTGSTLMPFVSVLVIYFVLALIISWGVRSLERRMARGLDGVRV